MKKTKPGTLQRLCHIRDAILLSFDFIDGLDKVGFMQDLKTQAAVVRQIEIIGEAVYALPDDFTSSHPQVPWKNIAATRHKIVHDYFEVDIDVVWSIVKIKLPEFLNEVEAMIASLEL
jgi:uncharacterized protein with HEPN domain